MNKILTILIALVFLMPAVLFCHYPARQIAGIALQIVLAALLLVLRKAESP